MVLGHVLTMNRSKFHPTLLQLLVQQSSTPSSEAQQPSHFCLELFQGTSEDTMFESVWIVGTSILEQ